MDNIYTFYKNDWSSIHDWFQATQHGLTSLNNRCNLQKHGEISRRAILQLFA